MELQSVIESLTGFLCFLMYFIYGYLFYRVLCIILPVKAAWFFRLPAYISCAFLSSMVIYPNDMVNITLAFFWFVALVLIAYRGGLARKLGAVAILFPLIIALNFLIMDISIYIYVKTGRHFLGNILGSLNDNLLHILFWFLVFRFFKRHLMQIGSLLDNQTWVLLCVVCTASLVSITSIIFFAPENGSYIFWPSAFSCIITNIGCLYLSKYFLNSIRQNMERKNLKLQEEYYMELEANQLQIRKFRHDMGNHLNAIRFLLESGSRQEAEDYFKEIENQITVSSRVFCRNGIVNAVLNAKYNLAVENNIDCFFHIDLENSSGIDDISLCSLFANTLDNAIEACKKLTDPAGRYIRVRARTTKSGYFSYEISNAKAISSPVIKKNGGYVTDKPNPSLHGIGLSNVRDIAERYDGALDISDTVDTFTVTLLIRDAC